MAHLKQLTLINIDSSRGVYYLATNAQKPYAISGY